ncbi:MAG: hypothetical protein ACR2H0_08505 [Candidatus Limnocylindrales bacterium]
MRVRNNVFLDDAEFANNKVAVTWEEPRNGTTRVGFRTSTNSGSSFGSTEYVGHSEDSALDVCSSAVLHSAYSHEVGGGHWQIEHAVRSVGGSGFDRDLVFPNANNQHDPDIACAGGRVFVSWYEPSGMGDHLFVANARRSDGVFGLPLDLGLDNETTYGSSLAVAGVPGHAYAVFTRSDGDLRFMPFSIGSGAAMRVTPGPESVIANGTPNNSADYALIRAQGSKVVVAWFKCGGLFVRVSNDHGATWGPARRLLSNDSCGGDFAANWSSVAIDGSRVVAVYVGRGAFGGGVARLIDTTTDFASRTVDTISSNVQLEHMVGFVSVAGADKLAAAFNPFGKIRFRRET